jgi:general secretion pathway protein D
LLGSIPVLGRLFRSTAVQYTKTNLLVFIRATVIRDDETLTGATAEKYRYIRDQQMAKRERGALLGERGMMPVLPDLAAVEQSLVEQSLSAVEQSLTDYDQRPAESFVDAHDPIDLRSAPQKRVRR